uniref:Ig-like domain-containing protein n=1 Tax=Chrysemys picta bellii TaxID=8478 RepID=A0A8C3F7G1_CHRPI
MVVQILLVTSLRDITKSDDGTYRCKVVNDYGEDSSYAELFVKEFTLPLYNHTAYVGEHVRFGVTITVHPEPRVTWFKSGQKIKPGDDDRKYAFESDKGLYQLTIHNLTEDDDAEYSILARNKYGEDSCKAKLTVIPHPPPADTTLRPMFKRLLANAECQEGQSVCFEIRISGVPKPTLKWEKDGQPLSCGPNIEVVYEGLDYYALHIRDTLPEDSGYYRVTATNSAGSSSCQAYLKVERLTYVKHEYKSEEEREKHVQKQIDKTLRMAEILSGTETVRFSCAAESSILSVREVSWYKDGNKLKEDSHFMFHYSADGTYELKIHNLTESDQGEYTCEITGEGGVSKTNFQFVGQVFKSIHSQVSSMTEKSKTVEKEAEALKISTQKKSAVTTQEKEVVQEEIIKKSAVSEEAKRSHAEIKASSTKMTVSHGQKVTVKANIEGASEVKWVLNGMELPNSEDYRYGVSGNDHTLTIKKASHKDEGILTCEGKTDQGIVRCQFDMTFSTERSNAPAFITHGGVGGFRGEGRGQWRCGGVQGSGKRAGVLGSWGCSQPPALSGSWQGAGRDMPCSTYFPKAPTLLLLCFLYGTARTLPLFPPPLARAIS